MMTLNQVLNRCSVLILLVLLLHSAEAKILPEVGDTYKLGQETITLDAEHEALNRNWAFLWHWINDPSNKVHYDLLMDCATELGLTYEVKDDKGRIKKDPSGNTVYKLKRPLDHGVDHQKLSSAEKADHFIDLSRLKDDAPKLFDISKMEFCSDEKNESDQYCHEDATEEERNQIWEERTEDHLEKKLGIKGNDKVSDEKAFIRHANHYLILKEHLGGCEAIESEPIEHFLPIVKSVRDIDNRLSQNQNVKDKVRRFMNRLKPTLSTKSEPSTKQVKPEVTNPEVIKPEATKPEVAKPEVTKPEVTKPEVTKSEVIKPEVIKTEVTKPEVIKPEVIKPALKSALKSGIKSKPKMGVKFDLPETDETSTDLKLRTDDEIDAEAEKEAVLKAAAYYQANPEAAKKDMNELKKEAKKKFESDRKSQIAAEMKIKSIAEDDKIARLNSDLTPEKKVKTRAQKKAENDSKKAIAEADAEDKIGSKVKPKSGKNWLFQNPFKGTKVAPELTASPLQMDSPPGNPRPRAIDKQLQDKIEKFQNNYEKLKNQIVSQQLGTIDSIEKDVIQFRQENLSLRLKSDIDKLLKLENELAELDKSQEPLSQKDRADKIRLDHELLAIIDGSLPFSPELEKSTLEEWKRLISNFKNSIQNQKVDIHKLRERVKALDDAQLRLKILKSHPTDPKFNSELKKLESEIDLIVGSDKSSTAIVAPQKKGVVVPPPPSW